MTFSVNPIDDGKAWLALDRDPVFAAATPEYRCEALLAMADDLKCRDVVDDCEWGSWWRARKGLWRLSEIIWPLVRYVLRKIDRKAAPRLTVRLYSICRRAVS